MRMIWKASCLTLCAILLFSGVYFTRLYHTGNFHEIIPGELYRSSQPTADEIKDYAARYGIRTIVNLRGSTSSAWYKAEIAAAREAGIEHIDFRMTATKRVKPETLQSLAALLRSAPKPILIHCRAGSDRTGLASAVYLYDIAGKDEATAERQLSIYYGHVAIPVLSQAYAMDESWEDLEALLDIKS